MAFHCSLVPVSLTGFPSQSKFDGDFALLSPTTFTVIATAVLSWHVQKCYDLINSNWIAAKWFGGVIMSNNALTTVLNFAEKSQIMLTLCDVEVREWISNFIPHYTTYVITYPCCLVTHKDPVILQSQYRGCWFSGDTRSHGFSSLIIDWVLSVLKRLR